MARAFDGISWGRHPSDDPLTPHPAWRAWAKAIQAKHAEEARRQRERADEERRERREAQQRRDAAAIAAARQARTLMDGSSEESSVPWTINLDAVRAELSRTGGAPASRPVVPEDLGITPEDVIHDVAGSLIKLPTSGESTPEAWIGIPFPGADYLAIRALDQRVAAHTPRRLWISRRDDWDWALVADVPWLEVREAYGILGVETRRFVGTLPDLAHAVAQGLAEFSPARVLALRHADRLRGFQDRMRSDHSAPSPPGSATPSGASPPPCRCW